MKFQKILRQKLFRLSEVKGETSYMLGKLM